MSLLLPPLGADRARHIAAGFSSAAVLVIGDAMLDQFIVGRVTRISPEAPVPVVGFDHEMHRIGGAANVAHNIAALGARATLISVTGTDPAAETLRGACLGAGITPVFATDPGRPTTRKCRIVTDRKQQVARIDYENDNEIAGATEDVVVDAIRQHAARAGVIVVSDYLKGCVSRRVMAEALAAARAGGIPVLVDPKIPHLEYYAGATLITPNHHEAEFATHTRVRSTDEARVTAAAFRERARCDAVLMTRGDQGMWLLAAGVEGHLPAAAREVADVTGAGDTVIATVAASLACGATLTEAARLANAAAAIAVGRFGPATVSATELLASVGSDAVL